MIVKQEIEQAQNFLHRVQQNDAKNLLTPTCWQKRILEFNHEQETVLKSVNNGKIKRVDNFKYLGAWIDNTENKIKGQKSPSMEIL